VHAARAVPVDGRALTFADLGTAKEIPREGAVTRSYQYARWIGGVPLLWIGRRKSIGRGEGSSGLRFDLAK
jgi:hypothetical protein